MVMYLHLGGRGGKGKVGNYNNSDACTRDTNKMYKINIKTYYKIKKFYIYIID